MLLLLLANKAKGYLKGVRKLSPCLGPISPGPKRLGHLNVIRKCAVASEKPNGQGTTQNDKYFWSIVFLCWSRYSTVFSFFCPMLIWCMMVSLVIETQ